MAAEFYATDAVFLHIGEEHFHATLAELMRSDDYAICYIFELDGEIAGYSCTPRPTRRRRADSHSGSRRSTFFLRSVAAASERSFSPFC